MPSKPAQSKHPSLDEQVAAAAEAFRKARTVYELAFAAVDGTAQKAGALTKAISAKDAAFTAYNLLKRKQFSQKNRKKARSSKTQAS